MWRTIRVWRVPIDFEDGDGSGIVSSGSTRGWTHLMGSAMTWQYCGPISVLVDTLSLVEVTLDPLPLN